MATKKISQKGKIRLSKAASHSVQPAPIYTEEDRLAEAQRLVACICTRQNSTIQCTRCGNLTFGRVYRECRTHRNVVFLYDMRNCSKCQGPLNELEELPINFETFQKLIRLPKTT